MAYDPMTPEESTECLLCLIKEVVIALDEMHKFGFAHNDVQLPNICFDASFRVILIDLDRATSLCQSDTPKIILWAACTPAYLVKHMT